MNPVMQCPHCKAETEIFYGEIEPEVFGRGRLEAATRPIHCSACREVIKIEELNEEDLKKCIS